LRQLYCRGLRDVLAQFGTCRRTSARSKMVRIRRPVKRSLVLQATYEGLKVRSTQPVDRAPV